VNWAEGVAMTHLAKVILEDRMGYQVELTMADVAPVFTALAGGDSDAFLDAWLPLTHKEYMERFQGKVEDLGTNYEGARIGLVVPAYVKANSIPELAAMKKALDGQIIGIDSGAGIMSTTEKALAAYKLDLRLMSSSGPAMAASLQDAIKRERPVVVTGWKPHWKFARWDLKFLEDPQGIYGAAESIHTLTRPGLEKDKPEVARFLRAFKLDDQQLGDLMGVVAEAKGDPSDAAREWVKRHEALVDGWLPRS
jgi:glycine betaine/proline transport system substrate-binding protein